MKRYCVLLASLLLIACAENEYKATVFDNHFGQSVKHVTQAQYLNPQAAAHPPLDTPKRKDGMVGESVMNGYRQSFVSTQQQQQQIESVSIKTMGGSGGSGQ